MDDDDAYLGAASGDEENDIDDEETADVFDEGSSVTHRDVEDEDDEESYHEPSLAIFILEKFRSSDGETVLMTDFCGEGEAVFFGGHVYRGEFKNGVMHGKGIYIWSDGVQYEGDFEDSTVTGEGTYIWSDGSKYVGHVVNGIRHGYGAFYCSTRPPSIYEGQWEDGRRHGRGEIYFDEKKTSYYKGDWYYNRREGNGERRYGSGNVYIGQWRNNRRNGKGTMWWHNRGEKYTGDWHNGVQQGQGEHIWYHKRTTGSQYAIRNRYSGQWTSAYRDGYGVFEYATGARYEGEWKRNKKHGEGKFVFQSGVVFEGRFHDDSMSEGALVQETRSQTPEISLKGDVRPGSRGGLVDAQTHNPFSLAIEDLLDDDLSIDEELKQLHYVILRSIGQLRKIYHFYSVLGHRTAEDNTFVLDRFQLWRMFKDCDFLPGRTTLSEIDRVIDYCLGDDDDNAESIHSPSAQFLVRHFLRLLVYVAHHVYVDEYQYRTAQKPGSVLASCLSRLLEESILPNAMKIKGTFLVCPKEKIDHALQYKPTCWNLYKTQTQRRKIAPYDDVMTMRRFLFILNDSGLINANLTARLAVSVIARDNPTADDGIDLNLDTEIVFLEFFEALMECASIAIQPPPARRLSTKSEHEIIVIERKKEEEPSPPVDHPPVVVTTTTTTKNRRKSDDNVTKKKLDSASKSSLKRKSSKDLRKSGTKKTSIESNHDVKSATSSKHDLAKTSKSASSSLVSVASSVHQVVSNVSLAQQAIVEEADSEAEIDEPDVAVAAVASVEKIASRSSSIAPLEKMEDIPEDPFEFWCWQLDKFFNKHLFPAFGLSSN
ncbi:radial spoke head 10 homolog B-like [Oscarella lobularis]|uniref:radial spoke head 10 homolog B-like n=1 Tax=Oscarella lobularis TaxID=121494 RepID=UPI0033132C5E